MESPLVIQGRQIGAGELATIRELISTHPAWHRTRLSKELCREWIQWITQADNVRLFRRLLQHYHYLG